MNTNQSRMGWLRGLYVVLGIGLGLTGALTVVGIVATYAGAGLSVSLPTDHVLPVSDTTALPGHAAIDPRGDITMTVADPSAGQATLSILGWLPTAVVVTVMIAMLLRIVRAALRAGPFTPSVVRRLRTLAFAVTIGGPVAWLIQFAAQFFLVEAVSDAGPAANLTFSLPLLWIVAGIGYLAVAEVANRGLTMQAELDEVI